MMFICMLIKYACEKIYDDVIDLFFFVKQKTAYEMLISDWSSDVGSSDLGPTQPLRQTHGDQRYGDQQIDPIAVAPGTQTQHRPGQKRQEIGRATCRERVCQYV